MKLCVGCKYYKVGGSEDQDHCTHERAQFGGVRNVTLYTCKAMRAGICGKEALLFTAAEPLALESK